MRIGYGWDSHEFKPGIPLKIGGVTIAHPQGLAGHSDGDVLLHALTDALLGAIAAGDIGTYFPPADRHNLPSFRRVLMSIAKAWQEQRGGMVEQAAQLTEHIKEAMRGNRGNVDLACCIW